MSISLQNFLPTQIPGSVFWFDASDTSTMTFSGSSVTQWRDKSGNSRHANQNTAATFSTNSLVFSGSQYYTVANAANLFRNVYFAIFVVETQSGVNPTSFFMGDTAGGVTSGSLHIGYRSNSNLTMAFWAADLEVTGLSGTGVRRLWSFILPSTGNRFVNLNGSTVATYGNNSFLTAMSSLLIGSAFAYDFYRGSLFEVVGYTGSITGAQIQRMEGYLAWKWGLQGNLPSTHPYRFPSSVFQLRMSNQVATGQTITAFAATGAVQTFVVPGGVSSIRFFMWGAGGNNQNQNATIVNSVGGGSGAYLDGTIFVSPGTTLYIIVGVNGGTTLAQGGAGASTFSGSGGGFSGIFSGSPAAGNVIAIAGGGGGSGVNGGGNGGGGGYPSGGSGTGNNPGSGGSQSAGGSIGGAQLQGGATGAQGGGGGGGWYGGGAANNQNNGGGGGGGSSTYTSAVISPTSINGNTGISTNGSNTPAPNEASPYWLSPAGRSAASGRVVLVYSAAPSLVRLQPFFSPNMVSGLSLWLDGADPLRTGIRPTLNTTLTTWFDKSGNNRNASGGVPGTFVSGGVSFNGSSQFYTMSIPYPSNYSIFLVATNTTVAQCYFFGRNALGGGREPTFIQGYVGSGIGLEWYEGSDRATIVTTPSSPFMVSVDHTQGTNILGYYFGTQAFNISQTRAYNSTPWDTLGQSGVNANFYGGTMREVIFYGSVLTTFQRQQVEGYLAWKWGLQDNLPSNHPYRMRKP